jgi:hypothetical protein
MMLPTVPSAMLPPCVETVCSNKYTYLLESTSSQQLVVTFIMGMP